MTAPEHPAPQPQRRGSSGALPSGGSYTFAGQHSACGTARRATAPGQGAAAARLRFARGCSDGDIAGSRMRHVESEARMAALAQRAGARRSEGRLLRQRHRWQGEAVSLQRERKHAEKELREAVDALRRSAAREAGDSECAAAFAAELGAASAEDHEQAADRSALAAGLIAATAGCRARARAAGCGDRAALQRELGALRGECEGALQRLRAEEAALAAPPHTPREGPPCDASAAGAERLWAAAERALRAAEEACSQLSHVDGELRELFSDALRQRAAEGQRQAQELAPDPACASSWTPEEEEQFAAACRAHWAGGEAPRQQLSERLEIEFGGRRTRREVQQRLWDFERARYARQRCAAAVEEARRDIDRLGRAMQEALATAAQLHEAREAAAREQQARAREREALQARLGELRGERAAREAQRLEDELLRREQEELAARAEQQRHDEYVREQLERLAEHRARQAESDAALRRLREEEAELAARELQERQQRNEARTAFRRDELARHRAELDHKRRELEREREQRDRALDALAATVAPEVERDAKRVLRPTAASAAVGDGDLLHEHTRVRVNGYTNADLLKDKRFRLTEQLAKAGLLNTQYAREVIYGAYSCGKTAARAMQATTAANPMHVPYNPGPMQPPAGAVQPPG
eukprot:TRINITY_DN2597_c2_g1_i1.p1 TRINITY_DN2597_c2_g1~~TRINITY_DN2597_c2_g1_i1.p1  ORF type:complete len:672 (+),score=269.05 TRINITY_DN2597_c2_g1_i1:74-2017(+)